MSTPPHRRPDAAVRDEIVAQVQWRLGAIFSTVRRGSGVCQVCAGPATSPMCSKCAWHRGTYGSRLADLVVPLAYAVNGEQSGHHMYGYKSSLGSSDKNRRDVKVLMNGGMALHRQCISTAVGLRWSTVSFVPSYTRTGITHPVVEVAEQAMAWEPGADRLLLTPGPQIVAPRGAGPLPQRFVIAEQSRWIVPRRHIIVVDDTWVTGTKAQSAAIALKDAGARFVTIVCVARWLDRAYAGHSELIDSVRGLYDPRRCPVTGGACP